MKAKVYIPLTILCIIAICVLGLKQLHFQTDILHVLPKGNQAVESLKDFRKHFVKDRETIIILTSSDGEEIYPEDAEALASFLNEKMPDSQISSQSLFEQNPQIFAKSIARIWRHSQPGTIQEFTSRLNNTGYVSSRFEEIVSTIKSSADPQQGLIQSYDPLGFLSHPGLQELISNDFSFSSDSGQHRILIAEQTTKTPPSYQSDAAWIKKTSLLIEDWIAQEDFALDYALTGGPAFNAEIGSNMENDMRGTLGVTSSLIILLFLLFQRSFRQLFLVIVILAITFTFTLALAGFLFTSLNLVSVGFAAILIGLVIDYIIVILREAPNKVSSHHAFRKKIAPSISWAALSTAFVFGILTLSSFEGVRQLAGIVAIGLLIGAGTSLWLVPLFLSQFPTPLQKKGTHPRQLSTTVLVTFISLITVSAVTVLITKGAPQFDFELEMLDEEKSEATKGFNLLTKEFSAWSEDYAILLSKSHSPQELTQQSLEAKQSLDNLLAEKKIDSYQLPYQLIPHTLSPSQEHDPFSSVIQNSEKIIQVLTESGFSDKGVALTEQVFKALMNSDSFRYTNDPLIQMFYKESEQGTHFLQGRVLVKDSSIFSPPSSFPFDHTSITSWKALKSALLPQVKRDFYFVFIPSGVFLLMAMLLVFRSLQDTSFVILIMILAMLIIHAILALRGENWNSLSGMAIPLTIGAGIDYSIHLIFSLRRHQGDMKAVWNGVGKAICFCSLSTALGFGSLIFAASSGLRSLGFYCSIGVLISMILSLSVIPALWQRRFRLR